MSLFLCTSIQRMTADGDSVECDVVVNFRVAGFRRGWSPSFEPPDPGNPDEYDFAFEGADFDGAPPDEAPHDLTGTELNQLAAWLDGNYQEARVRAEDSRGGP